MAGSENDADADADDSSDKLVNDNHDGQVEDFLTLDEVKPTHKSSPLLVV